MTLRLANKETTKLDLGDGDWLEVVQDVSKGDFNKLIASMPSDIVDNKKGLTPVQGTQFQTALFETLVKSWSLDAPVTAENYLGLSKDSASIVDDKLIEYFSTLTPDAPKESGRKRSS